MSVLRGSFVQINGNGNHGLANYNEKDGYVVSVLL